MISYTLILYTSGTNFITSGFLHSGASGGIRRKIQMQLGLRTGPHEGDRILGDVRREGGRPQNYLHQQRPCAGAGRPYLTL